MGCLCYGVTIYISSPYDLIQYIQIDKKYVSQSNFYIQNVIINYYHYYKKEYFIE
jgi:hypothetical protein